MSRGSSNNMSGSNMVPLGSSGRVGVGGSSSSSSSSSSSGSSLLKPSYLSLPPPSSSSSSMPTMPPRNYDMPNMPNRDFPNMPNMQTAMVSFGKLTNQEFLNEGGLNMTK